MSSAAHVQHSLLALPLSLFFFFIVSSSFCVCVFFFFELCFYLCRLQVTFCHALHLKKGGQPLGSAIGQPTQNKQCKVSFLTLVKSLSLLSVSSLSYTFYLFLSLSLLLSSSVSLFVSLSLFRGCFPVSDATERDRWPACTGRVSVHRRLCPTHHIHHSFHTAEP